MSKTVLYKDAIEELQGIVAQIENNTIGIDELSERVTRATELIEICKKKLYTTEKSVTKALNKLNQE
jgi:exodeoxyribonuclease VII small subunit